MRTGIIDFGTNSLKFSFWEISSPKRRAQLLYQKKIMILPGQDVFRTGKIPKKTINRIIKGLRFYEAKARQLKIDGTVALATSALREAKNSNAILKLIQSETSIPLKIISGRREAELIAYGILKKEARLKGAQLFIDIGGGSTEISLVVNRRILLSTSLPLGGQRLYQLYPKLMQSKFRDSRFQTKDAIQSHIRKTLAKKLKTWPRNKAERALCSSGTSRSLAKLIDHRRGLQFTNLELSQLNQRLLALTESQLNRLAKVEPERRALLVHGALLLEEILNFFSLSMPSTPKAPLKRVCSQKLWPKELSLSLFVKRFKARNELL